MIKKQNFIYSLTIGLVFILTFIAYAFYNVNQRVTSLFNYILLLLLLIDFVLMFMNKEWKMWNKSKILAMLFLVFNFLTIIINDNIVNSFKIFTFSCLQLIILFNYTDKRWKITGIILTNFIVCTFITSIIGITLYFNGINITLYTGRHCGIYSNPNIGGILAVISLIFSIIILKRFQIFKIFLIFNIIVQSIEIILCGSRASYVTLLIFMLVFSYFVSRILRFNKVKAIIFSFVIMLASISTYIVIEKSIVYVKNEIYLYSIRDEEAIPKNSVINIEKENTDTVAEDNNVDAEEVDSRIANLGRDNSEESTMGRIEFILNGLRTGLKHPILGVSSANLSRALLENANTEYSAMVVGGSHNSYVDLFVSNGIIGLLVFLLIILVVLYKGFLHIKILLITDDYETKDEIIYLGIYSLFFSLIFYGLFESNLILSGSIVATVFWFCGGYLVNDKKEVKYHNSSI
ncbi:hypothetical protein DXB22_20815 [Clostridiaceae bacterium OM02-2AC]|nr:hypothetical protein DXB22_20815 [Clostridiaceae bacterium OM02-2AC]